MDRTQSQKGRYGMYLLIALKSMITKLQSVEP